MPAPSFCHLHTHTQYSLLDGASRLHNLIQRAREMNQPALAITDHGNMFGAMEFYKACQKTSQETEQDGLPPLKPILGMEAYIVPNGESRTKRERIEGEYDHHLLLWASNLDGYKNLMKLSTYAYKEGFYYHARVDRDLLARYSQGLLASSGCIGSEVPQTILRKDYAAAYKQAGIYQEIFGKENFYFELQNHCAVLADSPAATDAQRELASSQKKVNEAIIKIARELGGKLIATNDSHYVDRSDAKAHDVLLCIGTGKLLSESNRLKFACDEFYLKSSEEMARLFDESAPAALSNTLEVAERCTLDLKFGAYHFPKFKIPGGEDQNQYFRRHVEEGLARRYGQPIPKHVQARADEELRVLKQMGFVSYLLIVWDIIREAGVRGIPVGPGRGSAAGSIVCYALGITNLDPLRYQLLFERFVNEGRNEMPDIDIDFCQSRRAEVMAYVQDKYGRDCTANIITFSTMQAKGAVRDVGRVLNRELAEVNRIAKLIPAVPGRTILLQAAPPSRNPEDETHYAVDDEPELAALYEKDATTRELLDLARKCEGTARNAGCHPAGLVIADQNVVEYCPLCVDKNGTTLTQYEMAHLDSVGLLKIDLLGLETLTKIAMAIRLIKQRRGVTLDLEKIPLDDVKTYQLLGRGDALAVFQFESPGMRRLLIDARPDCLEDLVALNAMYRPGPLQNIPSFCARKHGREPIEYLTPQLESILKDTYGIIVYQEQVMQIANQLAGFTLSEADTLRKAMGKKMPGLMEKYGARFLKGCAERNVDETKAVALYNLILEFAKYGFNRSHATAYALLAYQTAYLKTHYSAEFMASNLSLEQGGPKKSKVVEYIDEARRMGLDVLPPDINQSGVYFGIENEKLLRFSLGAIKGVGEKAVEAIVAERQKSGSFKDLYSFCERVDSRAANRACVESLIKAGAFDSISDDYDRAALLAALEDALAYGIRLREDRHSGQGSLFGDDTSQLSARPRMPQVAAWTEKQRLDQEKAVLGFYFSGHPLTEARELVEGLSSCSIKSLSEIPEGYVVLIGAYVNQLDTKITRAKGEKMAVLNVEDFTGNTQVVIFPRAYEKFKNLLQPDQILFFYGKTKISDYNAATSSRADAENDEVPTVTIMSDEILTVEAAAQRFIGEVSFNLSAEFNGHDHAEAQARFRSLLGILKNYPGKTPVYFNLELDNGPGAPAVVSVRAGDNVRISPAPELFVSLRNLLKPGSIRVTSESSRPKKAETPAWKRR
ncbi:MAG: DNA polymerase III subunit alpha [Planctomycetota bacterium]